jgi:hypothetical protein
MAAQIPHIGHIYRCGTSSESHKTKYSALKVRFLEKMQRPLTDQDMARINFDAVWREWMCGTLASGRAVTPRPKIWLRTPPISVNAGE